jgi:hypothetical protein
MINDKNLKQEGGEQSTNFQGQIINVHNGITYSDAKEIALDVFNANFIRLKSEAAQIASERAEEITEKIIKQLNEKNPASLDEFKNPAMQDALFKTQKEYAKSGDKELGDLLVDILVDRANTPLRNMVQLVLDESLTIAPKLTTEQFDILTLNFLLAQTVNRNIINLETFKNYIDKNIIPFVDNLTSERTSFNYIEYLGCGHVRVGDYGKLEENFKRKYKAVFSKGFTKEDFESEVGSFEEYGIFTMQCLHDNTKFQINTIDEQILIENMTKENVEPQIQNKLKLFFTKTTFDNAEIKNYLVSINSKMDDVFNIWDNSLMKKLELSSVGVAIAHANYRRKTGITLDLTNWIK